MNKVAEIDFLIIGQGLAGSALAVLAIQSNYKVLVLDNPSQNRSSLMAAGLFNPFTGRNLAKTWMADEIFPALFRYYRLAESLTGTRFFYETPLYRPFASIEEQNEWMAKSADVQFDRYIEKISPRGFFGEDVREPFGGVIFKHAGYIDTRSYVASVRKYLESKDAFRAGDFEAEKLVITADHVTFGDVKARKIIFCQGVYNRTNPWFGHLPVRSLKGEFLTVQCQWENNVILNRGVHMVPGPTKDEWRVGSTYNWNDHSPEITIGARNELIVKLEDLFRRSYTITGQNWGVRPTTPDRKPMLGAHPTHKPLIIFNGLGTKGVSLAPYFSEVLIRWMENEGTIHKEADVTRFY